MYRILEALVRWIAPVLTFTAEEAWQHMPAREGDSPLFATWYDGLAPLPQDASVSAADFESLLALREAVAAVLEPMRAAGAIGAGLAAEVDVYIDDALHGRLAEVAAELRFLFITSGLRLHPLSPRPADAVRAALPSGEAWILARPSKHAKCVRCWHYREEVGALADHPELCARCLENVEGAGEERRFF
jgi:isoleucyl-tRNA synthetase